MHRSIHLARVAFLAAVLPILCAAQQSLPNGVAAGDVTSTSAVLWARLEAPETVQFDVFLAGTSTPVATATYDVVDPTLPATVQITGLQADTRYDYTVSTASLAATRGVFRTPAVGVQRGLTFGVSGDARGDLRPYPAIGNVANRDLDFFVMLGDTTYADIPSPAFPGLQAQTLADFRVKHDEVLGSELGVNSMADLRASTAYYAMIDDHEVTNDFSGAEHPSNDPRFAFTTEQFISETQLYRDGVQAFEEYAGRIPQVWSSTEARFNGKPKLYLSRRYGTDAQFFLLDARTFRDPPIAPVADPRDPTQVAAFQAASFTPGRTMLGMTQLRELGQDLLQAQNAGVTWKFIMLPEPIMNLGVIAAPDRYDGYAWERSLVLSYIRERGIKNVVFVSADLHGMLVNNLTYQTTAGGPQIPVDAFEVVTGAVAFYPPYGPLTVATHLFLGLVTPGEYQNYLQRPASFQDVFLTSVLNRHVMGLGQDPLGLQGSGLNSTLLQGRYVAAHGFCWTEFAIDATTQDLTVTTFDVQAYDANEIANDPAGILARQSAVRSRFVVRPK